MRNFRARVAILIACLTVLFGVRTSTFTGGVRWLNDQVTAARSDHGRSQSGVGTASEEEEEEQGDEEGQRDLEEGYAEASRDAFQYEMEETSRLVARRGNGISVLTDLTHGEALVRPPRVA